jgi:23S rRNA (uracil1939-C5)-methyltransferase
MKLALEKPVYGGDCLAHHEGKAVFVPLTLPGETISAHLTEDKRSFAKAELDEVLIASPNRVAPQCPYFGSCGGCHYQHADYSAQLALKQQILRETLLRSGLEHNRTGAAIPSEIGVLAGNPWAYRNRIRLAFLDSGKFGYRSRRSHAIVPIRECPIAAPGLLAAAQQIAVFLSENDNPVQITELELFANHDASQMLLTLFCEKTPVKDAQPWLAALHATLPAQTAGLRVELADGALNPQVLAASGESSLIYSAKGFRYRVDHGAFFQINHWLLNDFVELVTASHSGKLAWDLFAGVGLFARPLTASFAEVLAVESAPASYDALQHNLAGTTGRPIGSTTLDFLRRNRQEREPRPDLIVLDPPRAGLGEETTSLLNAIHAPKMIYVSCDPATLARDLRALTQERYKIERITLVDMFPHTFHLETVVQLSRS